MTISSLKKLFPDLEEELYNELMEHGTIKKVDAGEILLKVGQNIRSVMLIVEGIVKLYREDEEGKEFFIYNLNAGQACSLSMVCSTRHQVSEVLAKALTDVTLLSVPPAYMELWMNTYKSW